MAYPLPSCSAFQARSGSRLCVVSTNGTPYSFFARNPAIETYQVCVCTTSTAAERFDLDQIEAERFERGFELAFGAVGDFVPRLLAAHMQVASCR